MSHPSPPTGSAAASSHYFSNRSLTFELLYKSWPSLHPHLHPLTPLAWQRCLSPISFLHISFDLFLAQCFVRKISPQSYLFVRVWERESLDDGLDRSTVHTAQSILQLQKLLWEKQKKEFLRKCLIFVIFFSQRKNKITQTFKHI